MSKSMKDELAELEAEQEEFRALAKVALKKGNRKKWMALLKEAKLFDKIIRQRKAKLARS